MPICMLALPACAPSGSTELPAPEGGDRLRPGDVVQLVIWREEDLSGEFMVDQTGHVILPRVGKWDVREETEQSLEERLGEELRRDLKNAAIDVIVLRRIQILGAVVEPGLYALDSTIKLGEALATAGGVGPSGRRDRVDVVRGAERYIIDVELDRTLSDLKLRSGDSLYVPQRNWFLRNYPAVLTAASSLAGVAAVLLSIL